MFTGNCNDKKIVMQMNLREDPLGYSEVTSGYPESILICSDGSVIAGDGGKDISIVSWFPCFEMLEFYSGDEDGKINMEFYSAEEPLLESLNINYLMAGPI